MSNIYLDILRFADKKGLDGFTKEEVISEFGEKSVPVWLSAVKSGAFVYLDIPGGEPRDRETHKVLGMEGKFKLLDHQEMIDARRSAQSATKLSRCAIISSLILGLSSIVVTAYFSYLQINSPVLLNEAQLTKIIESHASPTPDRKVPISICNLPSPKPPCR